MHKELSLLLTVVGVCVDIYTIPPRPVNAVWLTESAMGRPMFCQYGAHDALGVHYSRQVKYIGMKKKIISKIKRLLLISLPPFL